MKEASLKPHRSRYWLNPKIDDESEHRRQVAAVCDLYHEAQALEARGTHVISCDEKTGIQALERIAATKPARPGLVERREYEYRRHGTLCLIASFAVATGEIVARSIGPTRDEQDFAAHIEATIATDVAGDWIFVADNLTTHCSETLVRLVADYEGLDIDLGKKGCQGILRNVASRVEFLTDPSRRIRFVYTPKHCSWLNQVEIWFSILSRRLLNRASFASVEELQSKLHAFIDYFNELLAKPFRWTYTGRPLSA